MTISNTIEKEGGFDSPIVAPRERNNIKGGSRTQGRSLRRQKPLRKRPSTSQQKRKGGGGFDFLKMAPWERNNTKVGSKTRKRTLGKARPLRKRPMVIQ
jgi:hypothetical protein